MKPTIGDNVDTGIDGDGNLHFVLVNSRRHLTIKADQVTAQIVRLMDGSHSLEDILQAIDNRVTAEELAILVDKMLELGLIRDGSDNVQQQDDSRYSRQESFFGDFVDAPQAAQERLAQAVVAVIGLGAIGSSIAAQLARAGVGRINACDTDIVSESNLPRNTLFIDADIGLDKTSAAASRLACCAPGVEITAVDMEVRSPDEVRQLAHGCDLVINCADQPNVAQTSEWVGQACMDLGLPHILAGGYRTHLGFIGPTVIPGESACWKCFDLDYLRNDPFGAGRWKPLTEHRPSGGSIGPLAAVVAGIHAWEAVRIITGILPPSMVNRKGEIDFCDLSLSFHDVERQADCPECGGFA